MTIINNPDDEPRSLLEIFDKFKDKELTVTMTVEELLVISTVFSTISGCPITSARKTVDNIMNTVGQPAIHPIKTLINECYLKHHRNVLSNDMYFISTIRDVFVEKTDK